MTERVREVLTMIAEPRDLGRIVKLASPRATDEPEERWRYSVATALVNPRDESEWSFLRKCASNAFDDGWVDAGAIQTLKLTASPRSRKILEEALGKNPDRSPEIRAAINYIRTKPAPLADSDLVSLAKRVAQVIAVGTWDGNDEPRFNEAGNKALINFTFLAGRDELIYTATFHRAGGKWVLRGVRETEQGLMVPLAPAK